MKYKLLWIRHAESISNVYKYKFNIHPFLSYKGLLETFNLGKKLLEVKIDKVYCSPSLRTILTSLISITIYNLENNDKIKNIKIIPHISEINPIIYYLGDNNNYINKIKRLILKYNNQNNIPKYNDLYKLTKKCIEWLNSNMISFVLKDKILLFLYKNKIDQEIITKIKNYNGDEIKLKIKLLEIIESNNLDNNSEILNLLNLKLDFNLLDFYHLENLSKNKYDKINIYKYLYDHKSNEINRETILLFSHKYYINKITKKNLNLRNCDIYKENIIIDNKKNILKKSKNLIKFKSHEKIDLEKNNFIIETIQKKINNIIDNNLINGY